MDRKTRKDSKYGFYILMNKFLAILCSLWLLSLSACGGGSTTAVAPVAGNTINGVANLGVVINGVVTAYKLTNGLRGAQVGTPATTQADGTFAIDVGTYAGPVVLVLSNPNSNATFMDEATGNQTALPVAAANSTVSSVLSAVAANQSATITPLTDIVAAAAMNSAVNGAVDSTAILNATIFVANAFGLNGVDLLVTQPANLGVSAGTGNAAKYAGVLAGIAKVAAVNATTTTVNNAATPGDKLIAQTKAYANAMFNAQGQPQAPTALTAGDNFTTLNTQVANFNAAPPAGLTAPAVVATPTGATYAGSSYYYVFQSFRDADANVDYMERGTMILDASATVTPLEAWDYTLAAQANNGTVPAASLLAQFTTPLTVNQNGSWLIPNAGFGGNISADGLIFAGAGIQNGQTSNDIIYGVKKPAINITNADLAGKVFDFTSQGSAINNVGFVEYTEAIGNITFSANGTTLTYTSTETVNQVVGAPTTMANIAFTITADGMIKVVDPAINMVMYMAPSEGGKYAVWSEANYAPLNAKRQFKSVGFAIARSTVTPSVANTAYNYTAAYWTSAGLTTAASLVPTAGPQVEQGLLAFGATSSATPPSVSMQQVSALNTTKACGVAVVGACAGPVARFTFTGGANGSATMTGGGMTFSGFASADGNVASFPGVVAIKQ